MPRYPVLDSLHHDGKAYGPDEKLKTIELAEDDASRLLRAGVLGEAVKGEAGKPAAKKAASKKAAASE